MRVNWVVSSTLRSFLLILFLILLFNGSSHQVFTVERLKLGTTTSTENSGLLGVLLAPFEKKTGIKVDVIAIGTGKAIKLGENGDVDVILVHNRKAENEFIARGFGINRKDVMYNDFIILGPENDPVGIKKAKNAIDAFKLIFNKKAPFISRGDDSGTYKKEIEIWQKAGIRPQGIWYKEAGQSMESVIMMADNLNAYTLSDRATYIALKKKVKLAIDYQRDPSLWNPYGIIAVNPEKHKSINYNAAMSFINWIISKEGQKIIKNYKIGGEQLFYTYK